MLRQYTFNLKSRILDCFDFLQKSRNDGVGGIVIAICFAFCVVIAICFAFCVVIARFGNAESWQSKQTLKIKYARSVNLRPLSVIARALPEAIQKIQGFCYFLLSQKVESPYPIDSNPQSEIPQIHSWLIYFTHCFKTRVLDTSLHCVPLSMTKRFGLLCLVKGKYRNDELKGVVILSLCKRRSIHFGDFRILRDSLTLGESMRLRFIRFTQFTRFATPHTTFKGIKMQT